MTAHAGVALAHQGPQLGGREPIAVFPDEVLLHRGHLEQGVAHQGQRKPLIVREFSHGVSQQLVGGRQGHGGGILEQRNGARRLSGDLRACNYGPLGQWSVRNKELPAP